MLPLIRAAACPAHLPSWTTHQTELVSALQPHTPWQLLTSQILAVFWSKYLIYWETQESPFLFCFSKTERNIQKIPPKMTRKLLTIVFCIRFNTTQSPASHSVSVSTHAQKIPPLLWCDSLILHAGLRKWLWNHLELKNSRMCFKSYENTHTMIFTL